VSDVGLYTALSGLQADQVALDAVSQNIANANTPGYVRTTVQLSSVPIAGVGSGVQVTGLAQITDPTLEASNNSATGQSAYAAANAATLTSIQNAFPEPSTTGLSSQLSALWADIDAAGNSAGSSSAANATATVVTQANTVATTLRSTAAQLQQVSDNATSSAAALIQRDNTLLKQVASLNGSIAAATATPQGPGGLTEQRNQAVAQLAADLGVTVRDQPDGAQTLYLGGVSLVQDTQAGTLSLSTGSPAQVMVQTASAPPIAAPSVGNGQGGTLGAEVDAINTVVGTYQTQLNQVASALASSLHTALGSAFVAGGSATSPAAASAQLFTSAGGPTTTAATFAVDPSVLANAGLIGFSSSATTDDGVVAQQLAENATTAASDSNSTFTVGTSTVASADTAWQQLVGVVGTATSQATTQATVAANAASNLSSQLQSVTGVDQNEQLTTMLQIQSAYQASAKVLSTINDTIQSLLAAI
jgi:flagellar hook-associated protein 1 FlgK